MPHDFSGCLRVSGFFTSDKNVAACLADTEYILPVKCVREFVRIYRMYCKNTSEKGVWNMARNTFSVTMRDGDKLEKRLKKLKTGCETAITRTVSDFRTRAPGWVNKGIRQHYGVDQAGVKSASVRIKNTASGTNTLSGLSIELLSSKLSAEESVTLNADDIPA